LAQLAVSSTICDDIAPNGANWGSDGKNLVIIDADLSPESFEGYLQLALKMPIEIDISFTSKTIEEMIKIYTALLGKIERNEIDPLPNLTALETNSFITFMQTACQNTIERISINPSFSINEILFQEINQQRAGYFASNAMK